MLVYRFDDKKLRSFLAKTLPPEEALVAYLAYSETDFKFRYQDLRGMGCTDSEIKDMVGRGSLDEVEVSRSEALSIAMTYKMRNDPEYRGEIMRRIKKAQDAAREKGIDFRPYAEKGRMVRVERVEARRRYLFEEVVIGKFGRGDGRRSPAKVSMKKVLRAVKKLPELLRMYGYGSPQEVEDMPLYMSVLRDLDDLGVERTSAGPEISRSLQKKLRADPDYTDACLRRVKYMTEVRMVQYEKDPEKHRRDLKKMVAARVRSLEENPRLRKHALAGLSQGPEALWKKYRADPEFRKSVRKKQMRGLDKGRRKIQRRAETRRNALRRVVEGRFGDVNDVGWSELIAYLEEKRRGFLERYYAGMSVASSVKKDLYRLRDDE